MEKEEKETKEKKTSNHLLLPVTSYLPHLWRRVTRIFILPKYAHSCSVIFAFSVSFLPKVLRPPPLPLASLSASLLPLPQMATSATLEAELALAMKGPSYYEQLLRSIRGLFEPMGCYFSVPSYQAENQDWDITFRALGE